MTGRFGAYGIDAPGVVLTFAAIGAVLSVITAVAFLLGVPVLPWITLVGALYAWATVGNLLYTTLAGKLEDLAGASGTAGPGLALAW